MLLTYREHQGYRAIYAATGVSVRALSEELSAARQAPASTLDRLEQIPGIDPDTGLRTGLGGNTGSSWMIYKGQLLVNMYDAANRKLIWTGLSSRNLDPKANAEKRQKHLNKVVQNLMKNYPPILVGGPH